jgi:hypothetical protein
MNVYADRTLPFVIGAAPVVVVVALAFLLLMAPQGGVSSHTPPQTPHSPTGLSVNPAASNSPVSPASSGTNPQPPSQGGGGSGGGQGGFCLPLVGCV